MAMTQDQLIMLLYKIVLIAGEVSVFGFVAVYSALAPWWRNPLGRTIVQLDLLIGAAMMLSILSLFFNFNRLTSHIAAWFDMGIFLLITLTLLARIPLFIKMHRRKKGTVGGEGTRDQYRS
jgi:hypothetical protein